MSMLQQRKVEPPREMVTNNVNTLLLWVFSLILGCLGIAFAILKHFYVGGSLFLLASALMPPPVPKQINEWIKKPVDKKFYWVFAGILIFAGSISIDNQATKRKIDKSIVENGSLDKHFNDIIEDRYQRLIDLCNKENFTGAKSIAEQFKAFHKTEYKQVKEVMVKIDIGLAIENIKKTDDVKVLYDSYVKLNKLLPENAEYKEKLEKYSLEFRQQEAQRLQDETVKRVEASKQRAADEKMALAKEKFKSQFSQWDGSHRGMEKLVKESMREPSSYQHVNTSARVNESGDEVTVTTSFRGKNGFGGVNVESMTATFNLKGEQVR